MRNTLLKLAILGFLTLTLTGLRLSAQTSLVTTGSVWKYLDDGSDQGTGWTALNFNDSAWLFGPGELGFGDTDEATVVSNNLQVTTYFRHAFELANPASISNLLLRAKRDDGIVVYLNGTEVFRDNLPAGTITNATLALVAATDDGATFLPAAISSALLVAGSNILAVEIHQSATTSSDISFDLSLTGNYIPEPPLATITSPTNNATLASGNIILQVTASDSDGSVTNVEFYGNGAKLGEDTTAPFNFVWSGMATGAYVLEAVATDATGLRGTSAPVNIAVVPAPPSLISVGSSWKYHNLGQDLGTAWTGLEYNDTAWMSGPGPLGNNNQPITTTIDIGPAGARFPTIYFRRTFTVGDPGLYAGIRARIQRDDGAVVYINGVEALRNGMADPPTVITYNTLATFTAEDANESNYYPHDLPVSLLTAGTNVVAVEVHQVNLTSSDLQFDLELIGLIPPTAIITSPANNDTINLPSDVTVTVTASDSDGTVAAVDFYRDGNFVGTDTTPPFSGIVSNLAEGLYTLTAVAIDNVGASGTSAPVNISVIDPNPPSIVGVQAGTNTVTVAYSKNVAPPGATNGANYSINNGISVLGAAYGSSSNIVVLTTSLIAGGVTNILTVNNVTGVSGGTIAPNSQAMFSIAEFTYVDLGSPQPAGSTIVSGGNYTLTAGGRGIDGTADELHFNYKQYAGDFDVKIRLQSLTLAETWTKAGIMARETLTPGSRYYASVATPGPSGCSFQYRGTNSTLPITTGAAPVTYPNTWLRVKRAGNTFSGFFSTDGNTWMQLGTIANQALSAQTYVGMFVSSRTNNNSATAQFSDFEEVSGNPPVASLSFAREPIGPSSRKTPFAITEIMYHPRDIPASPGRSLEFVEIYNSNPFPENLGRHRLSGSIDYTFPSNVVVKGGGFVVVARDPGFVQSHYGISGVFGPWEGTNMAGISTNGLPGSGGTVRLRGLADNVMLEVNYSGGAPYPVSADGPGHSIVLAKASYGEGDSRAWAASAAVDGSPGRDDPFSVDRLDSVVINEFLAHTDDPLQDYIELYNHANVAVDLSGAYLADESDFITDPAVTNHFYRLPNPTVIPARGFLSFNQTTLGFSLSASGERIYLVNSNKTRVVDSLGYDAQGNGVSMGRYPDGASAWYPMATRTPAAANSAPLPSPVVINEIMYSPISGNEDDEYVELYNRSGAPVNVSHWRFVDGITFTIPTNTTIAAGGYLVIAKNQANLFAKYGNLNTNNTRGDFNGTLGNAGERLALARPELTVVTNGGVPVTNTIYITVNEVTYGDGGRWGWWADGGGSSLELRDPDSDNRQSANWADSDESSKGIWTTIEVTNQIGSTIAGQGANNNLQIFLLGVGECLVDDVEVRNGGAGANLLTTNPGFETDLNGWFLQGSHDHSTIEPVGFTGTKSLHLRAGSRGDNGGNRIRSQAISASGTVVLRCRAKWVRGWPELLLRLHGGGLEIGGYLPQQPNLGSPGLVNSRALANSGPAVYEVSHNPVLPAANEPVVVSARVTDPDGPITLRLKYRVQPASTYTPVAMLDNGSGGDSIAGDGIYSATIPGQTTGAVVPFYVEAVDALNATNTFPTDVFPAPPMTRVFPLDASTRECVIRWGDRQMPGGFSTYRLWLTSDNTARWTARRPKLNNTPLDATFVYNNYRVIYNMKPQFAGSPWHQGAMDTGPDGADRVDFDIEYPNDDRFLGETDSVWNNPGNPGGSTSTSDTSAQSEQSCYIIFREMGIHYNYRRFMHLFVNGTQRSTSANVTGNFIFEDSQQPNGSVIDEFFPGDTDGQLFKIEDWFEFSDAEDGAGSLTFSIDDADLTRRMIPGTTNIQVSAYRFMFRNRARGAGESANDYTNLVNLIDIVSPVAFPSASRITNTVQLDEIADIEQWMRIFAVQHAVNNWDAYGWERGKNAYMYKPKSGRFCQQTWDIDFALGIDRTATDQPMFSASDSRIVAMWETPVYRRMYLRAIQDMVNGPLSTAYLNPIMDAKAAALTASGVSWNATLLNQQKTFVQGRQQYLQNTILATNVSAFSSAISGLTNFSTNVNFVILSGTAPIAVSEIFVNGVALQLTWTNVATWNARVALDPGVNTLNIQGYDLRGNPVANTARTLTINYTGPTASPIGSVVFNELMYQPAVPKSEFVELFNTSSNVAFNIGGWKINGLDFDFPDGTVIAPRQLIVVPKDIPAFAAAYGYGITPVGDFAGELDPDGETLTLLDTNGLVIDKLRYENQPPWFGTLPNSTTAIQLIDGAQDNSRVSQWSGGATWTQVTRTGNIVNGTNFLLWTTSAGSVFVDDITLVITSGGTNILLNGDFESGSLAPWIVATNMAGSYITNGVSRTGTRSLFLSSTIGAASLPPASTLQQSIMSTVTASNIYTLTYWVLAHTNALSVAARTTPGNNLSISGQSTVLQGTPGALNSVNSTLPAYDPVWLNELQAENVSGPLDNVGDREPWIELYNAGVTPVDLSGYYLANNYGSNLTQWQFPAGYSLGPGEFRLVWADGETFETSGTNAHTNFRLPIGNGTVALVRLVSGLPQITDYLTYTNLRSGLSYGDFPDGQPFSRTVFQTVTPGSTNNSKDVDVFINEWMAANATFLLDTTDNNYDDWFELYNAGDTAVDLGGYWLTDQIGNPKFEIPNNGHYVIPAGGFLLVWADNDSADNSTNLADLHVNFSLDANPGEALALYAPNGNTVIDSLSFGRQTNNISEGRYADGAANRYWMNTPTPRSPNVIAGGNSPPQITAIADRTVRLGQTVSFTATAVDAEAPPQTLTFSLAGSPPAGAMITAGGAFTWTPSPAQTPSVNDITVVVTDNGPGLLSDSETFTITVVPPPVAAISSDGLSVTVGFDTIPGRSYRLTYKENIDDPMWLILSAPVLATGNSLTIQDNFGAQTQRFYRVFQVD